MEVIERIPADKVGEFLLKEVIGECEPRFRKKKEILIPPYKSEKYAPEAALLTVTQNFNSALTGRKLNTVITVKFDWLYGGIFEYDLSGGVLLLPLFKNRLHYYKFTPIDKEPVKKVFFYTVDEKFIDISFEEILGLNK